jgi:hypothetical protein
MFYTKQIIFCEEGCSFLKYKLRLGVSFGLLRLTSWVGLDAVIKNSFFKIRITLSIPVEPYGFLSEPPATGS